MANLQGNTVLFASRDDIIKRTSFGGNIDTNKIVPSIYLAQVKYIQPLLGSVLYFKLQDDIKAGTLSGVYKTLVDNYITDALVWHSCSEVLPFIAYNIANAGISKYLPEGTEGISRNEIDYLVEKSLQNAQHFSDKLVSYLMAHNSTFPEYVATIGTSDQIYPDKGTQYNSSGWCLS